MIGAQTCQKRPRPQHLWAASEAKATGRVFVYLDAQPNRNISRDNQILEELAKFFQAPDTLLPGRDEATSRLEKPHKAV